MKTMFLFRRSLNIFFISVFSGVLPFRLHTILIAFSLSEKSVTVSSLSVGVSVSQDVAEMIECVAAWIEVEFGLSLNLAVYDVSPCVVTSKPDPTCSFFLKLEVYSFVPDC